jgi:two-component system chemotaxis response regulator CheY
MKLNILIVDDSAAIRKILLRVLTQTNLPVGEIYEANDGLEALSVLEKSAVNFVVTDINMPNMNGFELLAKIRSHNTWKKFPVVLITSEGSQTKVLEAVRLGANGYVRKPFTTEQIKEKLQTCMKEMGQ